MTATITEIDLTLFEAYEEATPCCGAIRSNCPDEAKWVMYVRLPICGHITEDVYFLCQPCKELLDEAPTLQCRTCKAQWLKSELIISLEPL